MQPPNPESTWSVFFKYPLQTLALILGGSAVAAAAGVSRHGDYAVALAWGALGFAILLGVSLQRVHQLLHAYDDFPAPVADLAIGRIWRQVDIEAWRARHPARTGRPPKA